MILTANPKNRLHKSPSQEPTKEASNGRERKAELLRGMKEPFVVLLYDFIVWEINDMQEC